MNSSFEGVNSHNNEVISLKNDGTDPKADAQTVRVAIYAGISDSQAGNWSLNSQVSEATEFVGRLPDHSVAETYVEEGHQARKGKANERPEFQRVMDDAKAGKFDVLVTTSVDRLTRNTVNLLEIVRELREYGVTYKSTHEGLDFSGPMGEFMLTQLGAFAQMQSLTLFQHTKRGLEERVLKKRGLHAARPPFGYQMCDESCEGAECSHVGCHPDPKNAPHVVEPFELYATGMYSFANLSDMMGERGLHISARQISRLLSNPFFMGSLTFRGQVLQGIHEPIISVELFERVEEMRRSKRVRSKVTGTSN